MSIVTESINQANAEGRYLNIEEIDWFRKYIVSAECGLNAAQVLTDNRERIVEQASQQLFQLHPDVVVSGGNAYGERKLAACLRDLDLYLRLITYAIVVNTVDVIREYGLVGAQETYYSLGTPTSAIAAGIRAMKDVASSLLSEKEKNEVDFYFEYTADAFSQMESACSVGSSQQSIGDTGEVPSHIRNLLKMRSRSERLREMSPERRGSYEQITELRDQVGSVDFDVVEALQELRGNA